MTRSERMRVLLLVSMTQTSLHQTSRSSYRRGLKQAMTATGLSVCCECVSSTASVGVASEA